MHFKTEGEERILRVHTVAKLSGCSRRTIRRRIHNHEIPASRIGHRAWGIRASDLSRDHEAYGGDHAGN
jgi:excisionase family DNA binding protein